MIDTIVNLGTLDWPDIVNATFEMSGAFFISLSIWQILKDKIVYSIHWGTIFFFTSWGFWNLFYYPHLDQMASFIGGIAIVTANFTYLCLIIYYKYIKQNKGAK